MRLTPRWSPAVGAGALSAAAAVAGFALIRRGAAAPALIAALFTLLTGVTAGALIQARRRRGPRATLAAVADRLALLSGAGPDPAPPLPVRLGVRPDDPEAERTVADLDEILMETEPRPMVVLGPPGSGKTFALARLCRRLTSARAPGGPVPVLLPVDSWEPIARSLPDWIALQLTTRFEGFADGDGATVLATARALVDEGFIAPILDGFPAGPGAPDPAALAAALPRGVRLVLTCRTDDPAAAWGRPGTAALLYLQPLRLTEVTDHLRSTAGNANAQRRWRPVFERMAADPDGPLLTALRSPLTLTLARTRYNPASGESFETLPGPEELLDAGRFPDRASIEAHLLESFVSAAYRSTGETSANRIARAERTLAALARELDLRGSHDLAWWELRLAIEDPRRVDRWLAGLLTTLAVLPFEPPAMAVLAGVIGFVAFALSSSGLPDALLDGRPRRLTLRPPGRASFLRNARLAVSSGVLVGAAVGVFEGVQTGLIAGAAMGFANWWVGPLRAVLGFDDAADIRAVSPRRAVAQDRWLTLVQTSEATITGTLVGYAMQIVPANGIPLGIGIGAVALLRGAWGRFVLARLWWRVRHAAPLRMLAFLEEAERHQVLIRFGPVYRFRHLAVQHRLTGDRPAAEGLATSLAAPTVVAGPPAVPAEPAAAGTGNRTAAAVHRSLADFRGPITKLAITPDRRFLVTAGSAPAALVWNLDDLGAPAVVAVTHSRWDTSPPPIRSFAVQADGGLLATGGIDGVIGLFGFGTPAEPRPIAAVRAHRADVAGLDFHPHAPLLAAAGGDNAVTLWDVADPSSPHLVATLRSHRRPVRSVRFSPDGAWLLTAGRDGAAQLWDLREPGDPRPHHRLPGDVGWIFVTAFHPEGTRLAIAGRRGRLTLWELPQTGTPVRLARIPRYRATAAFNADGSLLAAGHREGVGLWRPGEYAKPAAHLPGRFPVIALAFHPARQAVVGGGLDGSIALWSYDLTSPSFDTAQGTNTT